MTARLPPKPAGGPVLLALLLLGAGRAAAGAPDGFSESPYLRAGFSADRAALVFLGVDSLGGGRVARNVLPPGEPAASAGRGWRLEAEPRAIRLDSEWGPGAPPAPLVLTIDTHACYGTLLGLFDASGGIALPAVLHLPGYGTLRVTSGAPGGSLGYASGPGWIRVSFPPASPAAPRSGYRLEVVTICPAAGDDPRLDGFRRNWLNIFQLNPNRRILSNNTNSDSCGFCYYEYADIARETPPLADGLEALDIVRQSLESVLAGTKTYGMPGYGDFPEDSADTLPSLLIAADDYVEGRGDWAWLGVRYPAIRAMAEAMLATDRDGDGLVKYVATGNSGSWNEGQPRVRPSNWWDTIGFGHEDAYANALAYRALGGMRRMAEGLGRGADARRYGEAARRLHDAYFAAFLNPATGILAGWRSADGQLHDYGFLFVNSIAVLYGLVPGDRAAPLMDRLWSRIAQAGFTNFRLGLPGNLVSVARRDYAHKEPRYGGGVREDNADGFQVYCNGGATACFAYFTIAALDRVGMRDRADRVLYPILAAFDAREFEGTGRNGMTNDWRKWDGTAEGYEGFLVDNYYALLAVPQRRGAYGSR
jgi:hypothetical protein